MLSRDCEFDGCRVLAVVVLDLTNNARLFPNHIPVEQDGWFGVSRRFVVLIQDTRCLDIIIGKADCKVFTVGQVFK